LTGDKLTRCSRFSVAARQPMTPSARVNTLREDVDVDVNADADADAEEVTCFRAFINQSDPVSSLINHDTLLQGA